MVAQTNLRQRFCVADFGPVFDDADEGVDEGLIKVIA